MLVGRPLTHGEQGERTSCTATFRSCFLTFDPPTLNPEGGAQLNNGKSQNVKSLRKTLLSPSIYGFGTFAWHWIWVFVGAGEMAQNRGSNFKKIDINETEWPSKRVYICCMFICVYVCNDTNMGQSLWHLLELKFELCCPKNFEHFFYFPPHPVQERKNLYLKIQKPKKIVSRLTKVLKILLFMVETYF